MQFAQSTPEQADEITALFTQVFSDSEGVEEGRVIGNLVAELQSTTDPQEILGFIARSDEQLLGAIYFTRMHFDNGIKAFILSPVAVATSSQKQGVGQQLINYGIDVLKQQGAELLFTYGDPNYYCKVGFQQISETLIKAPLQLTYPEGWLAQSLTGEEIQPISGSSRCVPALSDQSYW